MRKERDTNEPDTLEELTPEQLAALFVAYFKPIPEGEMVEPDESCFLI